MDDGILFLLFLKVFNDIDVTKLIQRMNIFILPKKKEVVFCQV